MRYLCFSIIAFLLLNSAEDNLTWCPERPIQWADFKGRPSSGGTNAAIIVTGIDFRVISKYKHELPSYLIKAVMIPSESWTRSNSTSLLRHERLHFDICELIARKIRYSIDSLNRNGIMNYDVYNTIIIKTIDQKYAMNKLYDRETNHGIIREKQELWERKIRNELESLNDFVLQPEYCDN